MAWWDNIHSLQVMRLDYGDDFSRNNRFDYSIVTYTADGNQDSIPGIFESGTKALDRIRELAEIIKQKTLRKCHVFQEFLDADINCEGTTKQKELLTKRKETKQAKFRARAEKTKEMQQSNCFAGGAYDHSQR